MRDYAEPMVYMKPEPACIDCGKPPLKISGEKRVKRWVRPSARMVAYGMRHFLTGQVTEETQFDHGDSENTDE